MTRRALTALCDADYLRFLTIERELRRYLRDKVAFNSQQNVWQTAEICFRHSRKGRDFVETVQFSINWSPQ